MPRRNGPGMFLLSVGLVILLTGLLTFLAIPAAAQMDAKEAYQEDTDPRSDREESIRFGATFGTGIGAGLSLLGWVLLRRSR